MATTVHVRCPECDTTDTLATTDLHLVICPHHAFYGWRCYGCEKHVSVLAVNTTVIRLRGAGVPTITVVHERGIGEAVTEDEMYAFVRELEAEPLPVSALLPVVR